MAATRTAAAGEADRDLGRYEEAAELHGRAVATFRRFGADQWPMAVALDNLAMSLAAVGRPLQARDGWTEALAVLPAFTDPAAMAMRRRIEVALGSL